LSKLKSFEEKYFLTRKEVFDSSDVLKSFKYKLKGLLLNGERNHVLFMWKTLTALHIYCQIYI
jgi:SRSO17 transposase